MLKNNFKCFPRLKNEELYLSWLLGLYDGDGFQDKTMLCSKSKGILEKIKDHFKIKYNIRKYNKPQKGKRETNNNLKTQNEGTIFILTLGSVLFNKMITNYTKSLPRKRIFFSEQHQSMDKLKRKVGTKKNLQNLVNQYRKSDLISMLNVSEYSLNKLLLIILFLYLRIVNNFLLSKLCI
ncbi:MAG: hypothetical protein P8Y97_15475 [Candidatus Lokiarchaeota archaeon]